MTRTRLSSTSDLSKWIVSDPPHRQSKPDPSYNLSSSEEMDVEDDEPRPARRGPKRKRDAEKSKEDGGQEEREEEREFEKSEEETWKRYTPLRTGRFHNPKCERCEKAGKACEKQKTGTACYQCAVPRKRCVPTGGSGEKRRNTPRRTVEEKLVPPLASRVAPQPLSPKPARTIPKISPQSTKTRFVRDKNYYHESGDLAFIVEDILFKVNTLAVSQTIEYSLITVDQVHRFQLERCSSSFADKLLPLGGKQAQLLTETVAENGAFILQDKVDEFRALCWALYAP
jgi:hypothetical protein